jgi:hypothetical protein
VWKVQPVGAAVWTPENRNEDIDHHLEIVSTLVYSSFVLNSILPGLFPLFVSEDHPCMYETSTS